MSAIHRVKYKNESCIRGGQEVFNIDNFKSYPRITMLVDLVSGEMECFPEFTLDDLTGAPGDIRWIPYGDALPLTKTTTPPVIFDFHLTGIRLNITKITGEIRLSISEGLGH
jgi:hypothetical protein